MSLKIDSGAIDLAKIKWSQTIRLFDPNGRVFSYDGAIYRAIYPHRVDFVKGLFSRGVVDELVEKGLLVGTRLTDLRLDGFGLVLQHDPIDVLSKPSEWSSVTYKEAAKLYLDLFRALLKHDLTLCDGHSSNISLAPGGRTVWHDFGSIVELGFGDSAQNVDGSRLLKIFKGYQTKGGLSEFCDHFYYPLKLHQHLNYYPLLQKFGMCCPKEVFHRLRYPRLSRFVDRAFRAEGGLPIGGRLRQLIRQVWFKSGYISWRQLLMGAAKLGMERRELNLEKLANKLAADVERVKINYSDTTWGHYYAASTGANFGTPGGNRQKKVLELIEGIKPDRVFDIGANAGLFSHLAYKHARSVISADYDETAVAKHASLLQGRDANERIYPLIVNIVFAGETDRERFRSYTVLALALTHHLRLGQGYPFDFIAGRLAGFAEKFLITEFMPNGLGQMKKYPDPLPDDYTLDAFVAALKIYFRKVAVVDYELEPSNSPRILVLCEK